MKPDRRAFLRGGAAAVGAAVVRPERDGATFNAERDGARLAAAHCRVVEIMRDGKARTIYELASLIPNASEASISARLRDLRKPQHGGHRVDKEWGGNGVWRYRLTLNVGDQGRLEW